MKLIRLIFILFLGGNALVSFSQTGIGTTTPDASSILDVTSTTKGFLPPRMTYALVSSIASPATGLVVYCTDCNNGAGCLMTYQNTKWECSGGSGSLLPAPVATAASSIFCTGFTANWSAVTGATGYYFDVSTSSDFSSFVSGYSNLNTGNTLSQTVSGLSSSFTYYYRVRAYNTSSISSNSNTITAVTTSQPEAPVAAAATNIGCSGFDACWSAVKGATSYRLDVSTTSNFSTFFQSFNDFNAGQVTTIRVTPTSASTNYYYRVRAVFSCGTSGNSNTTTATTASSVSAPVANSVSNPGCTGFTATWNTISEATSYIIDISLFSSFTNFVAGYNGKSVGNVTSFDISGLSGGTTYYWRVKAVGNCGTSTASNTVTTSTLTAPATPTALAASNINCMGFTANWSVSSGASSYVLDVSTVSTFVSFIAGYQGFNVGNVTSYTVTGLTGSVTYYYRVRAINACVVTPSYSNTITVLQTGPSPIPTATAATSIVCTGFTANWTTSPGAASYALDVSTVSNFSTFVPGYQNLNVGNAVSYTVSGLSNNTGYYYRLRTVNLCATSDNSNTIALTTLYPPSAPTASAATNIVCTGFTANWAASAGAASYALDVSTVSNFSTFVPGYQNLNVGNVVSYAVSGLSNNTGYYFRLRAVNPCTTSASSNTIALTTLYLPSAPTASAATNIACTGFTANWASSAGAASYRLDVSTVSTFSTFVSGYQNLNVGNVTSFVVSGLSNNTGYYYRLRAVNPCTTSDNSGTIILTTLSLPSAPVATDASSVTNSGFTANWNAVSNATGYLFYLSTSSTFSTYVSGYNGYATGNVTSLLVSSLTPNTTYYYRLKTTGSCGTSVSYSNIIMVVTASGSYNTCGETLYYSTVSAGGYTWLDRNLGASRVATSSTDYLAYGSNFQWGRQADGHQCITWTSSTTGTAVNGITTTQCSNGVCPNPLFVINTIFDWNTPTNDYLWFSVKQTNDPCPSGYRVPTTTELEALSNSFSPQNSVGAFNSPVKMPMPGNRGWGGFGDMINTGTNAYYWSSSALAYSLKYYLYFNSSSTLMSWGEPSNGHSVRCIAQ